LTDVLAQINFNENNVGAVVTSLLLTGNNTALIVMNFNKITVELMTLSIITFYLSVD